MRTRSGRVEEAQQSLNSNIYKYKQEFPNIFLKSDVRLLSREHHDGTAS